MFVLTITPEQMAEAASGKTVTILRVPPRKQLRVEDCSLWHQQPLGAPISVAYSIAAP